MAKNVAKQNATTSDVMPDWAKDDKYRGQGTEGITAHSLKIPRIGLLQKVSPELDEDDSLKPGDWYHNTGGVSLGRVLNIVPCFSSESVIIWRDRKEGGGILARATDGAHWDTPDAEIEFTIAGKTVKLNLGKTVVASGLAEFGTSDPSRSSSAPIATRNINVACYLPDHPDMSPCIMTFKKSSHGIGQDFMTNLNQNAASSWMRNFVMSSISAGTATEPFLLPRFMPNGFVVDEQVAIITESIWDQFRKMASLDAEDQDAEKGVADPKTY